MNYLILNLAVADIMVALFIVPRFIFVHIFNHPDGLTGTVLCKLLTGGNLIWIGSVATAFTLVVVAIERYHAVINSHSNQGQLTATKVEVSGQGDCRRLFRTANYSVSPEKKKRCLSLSTIPREISSLIFTLLNLAPNPLWQRIHVKGNCVDLFI